MSTPPTGRPLTAQLLIDLVTDTLDPGYAAAAARRGPDRGRRWFDRPAVAVGCGLIGFVLVIAYVHTNRGAPEAAKVHDRLVQRVRTEQKNLSRLDSTAESLNAALSTLRAQAGLGSLTKQLDKEQLLAGQVAVTGPGLEVVLKEPSQPTASATPGRAGATPIGATHILTDRDVRSVVNELWADGAEAISVNDVRLTPTSAIRFAGEAVLVDFQPINSPYVIRAIGNSDDLATSFASSAVASRYHTLASADGIGFDFTEHSSLTLPANAGILPSLAHPAPTPTGTTR